MDCQDKTILVVEDNPANRKLVIDLLELSGFRVVSATDGATALDILDSTTPDLILLDINLPRMSGLEVFQKIKERPHLGGVTVVALTALAMKDDKSKILNQGFDEYISKPIDTREFIARVKQLVSDSKADVPEQ